MLNAKALSELLSKNSDERLCKRWFLMTPNGTLLAYNQPTHIRDLRRQAAKAALVWQEHQGTQYPDSAAADGLDASKISMPALLRTLTIEADDANLIIRKLQPQLLLVLEGGVPPRKQTFEPRVTPEGPGDATYPTQGGQSSGSAFGSSASSIAESAKSSVSQGVLGLQRRKLDALASAIAQNFEQTGFKMPEEGSTKIF
ncbi:hypothetical protein LTR37_009670 [Vermiconidia calcicola]|uniref:Uncharacterized protein n=1 Tax=Vermiconidia calcicola TaxID=1690605 RepID=A0ACC3N7C4_9PEZI|nr:hypothetical protein LTR37_009670 [Vermiconidia calcicola]